jgi:hypothetical protein
MENGILNKKWLNMKEKVAYNKILRYINKDLAMNLGRNLNKTEEL